MRPGFRRAYTAIAAWPNRRRRGFSTLEINGISWNYRDQERADSSAAMMKPRNAARLAWSVWGLLMALAVASLVLRHWNDSVLMTSTRGAEALVEVVWWMILIPAAVPAYATVGAIVASRRPGNWIGWLCLAFAFVIAVQDVAWQYSARALIVSPGSLPGGVTAAWISEVFGGSMMRIPLFVVMLLIFPDGRLLSRRWRPVVWISVAGASLMTLATIAGPNLFVGLSDEIPNPTAIESFAAASGTVETAGGWLAPPILLASVASVFMRWRGAGGIERQQLKWLAYTGAIIAFALLCGAASGYVSGLSYPTVVLLSVCVAGAAIGIPVAVAAAMLRYRLYDVDIIINRTLVYGALSMMLAGVYLGSVVLLQQTVHTLTGHDSQFAVVASTLVIAAVFAPLRRGVQGTIDRLFYRKRYDAAHTLEVFGARLREETDLDALGQDLVSVVRETMQPEYVSLWLRSDGEARG